MKPHDFAGDNNAGRKSPDEIKLGLECCGSVDRCRNGCPYGHTWYPKCIIDKSNDALALIQQLQDDNAEKDERIRVLESRNNALYHTILGVMHFVDKWIDDAPAYDPDEDLNGTVAIGRVSQAREITLQVIEQLQAERDAALADFKLYRERNIKGECGVYACDLCKRGGRYEDWDEIKCPTGCTGVSHWEWRGVQKEERSCTEWQ